MTQLQLRLEILMSLIVRKKKILVVHIDSKLSFDYHVLKLCQKARNKLYALARISPYMDQNKQRNLTRAFIYSQFQYCPLIWMFHGRQLNQKINKIQEKALSITYKESESTFSELLQKRTVQLLFIQRTCKYLC